MTQERITWEEECVFSFSRADIIEAVKNFESGRKILLEKSVLCKSLIESAEKYLLDEHGNLHKEIVEFEKAETQEDLEKYAMLNGLLMSLLQQRRDDFLSTDYIKEIQRQFNKEMNTLPPSLRKFLEDTKKVINSQLDQVLSQFQATFNGYELIYILSIKGNYFCSRDYETVKTTNVIDIIEKRTWLKNVINIAGILSLIELSSNKYSSLLKIFPTSRSIGTLAFQFKLPFISLNTQSGQGSKNHSKVLIDCLLDLIKSILGTKAHRNLLAVLKGFAIVFPGADIIIGFGVQFIECIVVRSTRKSIGVIVFEKIKRYLQRNGII
ncbi:hypothetical protein [Thermococcus sp.]|uniref:hypothetical protein n=1 Tax=Thermococcus sp. TaxID=35749 RepID=UPI0026216535|nr:hypothetical protein [Thermococcus sp.]